MARGGSVMRWGSEGLPDEVAPELRLCGEQEPAEGGSGEGV